MKFVIQKYTMLFPYGFGFPPKNPIKKKVSQWTIGQFNWTKWVKIRHYLFKIDYFSWKRQQVDMFLSTFVYHAKHC